MKQTVKKPKSIKPAEVSEAMPVKDYEYDERYVKFYCANPIAGKKQAIIDAGYAGKYPTQEACRIHKRNIIKINENVKERKQALALLSVFQLEQMLSKGAEEVGYSNMSQAIKQGFDYAGHKPTDKIEVTKQEDSYEDLIARRDALQSKAKH